MYLPLVVDHKEEVQEEEKRGRSQERSVKLKVFGCISGNRDSSRWWRKTLIRWRRRRRRCSRGMKRRRR